MPKSAKMVADVINLTLILTLILGLGVTLIEAPTLSLTATVTKVA